MARGPWGGTGDFQPLKARISWQMGTNVAQTGFHLRGATFEFGGVEDAATAVLDWVDDNFRTLLDLTDTVLGVDVVNRVTLEGFSISPASMVGTLNAGANVAPDFMCNTVIMKGELRAKYGQGRMFWPQRWENHETNDVLNSSGIAAFQSVITALTTRFTGNTVTGYNLINVHGLIPPRAATSTAPARPAVQPTWYDVTSLRLNNAVTFLRSRKAGVGS